MGLSLVFRGKRAKITGEVWGKSLEDRGDCRRLTIAEGAVGVHKDSGRR